ncbi:Competence protein ComM [Pelotomaculum schinkii]|uniref:Competence protein ComM n=1 Tax=Pelotomaculum schinkii TaxID=78350 RepID=A0A4Y7R910_9FIRM|nr:YifB family Mg chelatase-like AAA ATPase [Pelotomaculum schinkii]TEB05445.1 Competence protein ComM [Pelotomaculum schinkii]
MIAIVKSTALSGLDGQIVEVEVDVSRGLPSFDIVGLPDASVREAKDRVRTAIKNSGLEFPVKRITVNLAPADLKKEGPIYDLPIAVGILAATEQLPPERFQKYVYLGELSLNGTLRGVTGVLPNVLAVRDAALQQVVVPLENAQEAALVEGIDVFPASCLDELVAFLLGENEIAPYRLDLSELQAHPEEGAFDFEDIKGQQTAKRCLEVAAAGGHNVIMLGSPGSGKTMLARSLPGILPDLTFQESIDVTKIHSLAGLLPANRPLLIRRPFRSPHHTASTISIIGGGRIPKPGEVSLAHHGVLFLDEMPEFHKDTLEALRQPLEDGVVTISRINASLTYPARLMLVGALNPCPCGYHGDPVRECSCSPLQVQRYISRLSGPLLDRVDLHIQVPRLPYEDISQQPQGESSREIKNRVERAREIQRQRFSAEEPAGTLRSKPSCATCNAGMGPREIRQYCKLTKDAKALIKDAFSRLNLSARSYDRILKVSRTIADLAASKLIKEGHVAEALQYRSMDNKSL